ncbi:MAG: hypothetical protein V2I33_16530, partial [Kangiellaceae bacterium]|nr:hypothetical protein [Kangiellaceae bacterium]
MIEGVEFGRVWNVGVSLLNALRGSFGGVWSGFGAHASSAITKGVAAAVGWIGCSTGDFCSGMSHSTSTAGGFSGGSTGFSLRTLRCYYLRTTGTFPA